MIIKKIIICKGDSMEKDWLEIYEFQDYKETDELIWLEQILIDENIPYNKEIEEYWEGIRLPKYKKRLKIYIPKKYKKIVEKYIEESEDSKFIIKDNIEELKDVDDEQNDEEVRKYNKIGKIGFGLWMGFIFIVVILAFIGSIINKR